MAINRKVIRKVYSPLSISVNTKVEGSLFQLFDVLEQKHSPDRTVEPLKIRPIVYVKTGSQDSSWVDGDYTRKLTDIRWFANGQPIAQSGLKDGYSVDISQGADNGVLTLTKNLTSAEVYDLVMEATFYDARTKMNVKVQTDAVKIGVSEKAFDELDLSVVHDTNIKYYPLLDKLKEYDWKVANGIMAADEAKRKACFDGNQYLIDLPIIISKGANIINSDNESWNSCEVKLACMVNGQPVYVTPSDNIFVRELDKRHILLDARFIPDGTVMEVQLWNGVRMTGKETLTYTLKVTNYDCQPTNESDLDTSQTHRHDKAMLTCMGRVYEYPEAYLDIRWFTNTTNKKGVLQGNGESCMIDIAKAEIGSANDCWLEVYLITKVKAYAAVLTTDETGHVIVMDENNNVLTTEVLVG